MSAPATAPARWPTMVIAGLLIMHAATLIALCWQQKLTPDEANYVLAGCILRHDLRFDAYNTVLHGPLAFWPNQLGVLVADPADMASYAPWGRLGFVPFTLLAAVALHRLAARAFGPYAAVGAVLVWVTNPLVLAHGCLMTADMALTCTSLWTLERAWRWLQAPTVPRLVLVGVLLGATLATKYLGLLLLPTLAVALAWALARGFSPSLLWSRRRHRAGARTADAVLATAVVAVTAWLTLYTCYLWQPPRFRVHEPPAHVQVAPEDGTYGPKSDTLRAVARTSLGRAALELLPAPFVRGVDYQKLVSEGLPTFFGDTVAPGFWSYYVVAFATKLPLTLLLLLLVGVATRAPPWPPLLPPVAVAAVFVPLVFLSGITRLQIGVRYALPAVPWFCLLAGRGLGWLATRGRPSHVLALLAGAVLVAGAVRAWPAYLTEFNALAPRPYLWFKDSTLDWRVADQNDRDLSALRSRHPQARPIDGNIGPSFGEVIVHGEQLAPRDPRDPGRIHHWLRRFWPSDSAGAWLVFTIDDDAFRTAVAAADDRARAETEFATALIAAGRSDEAAALLRDNPDGDVGSLVAAAADMQSGDPARVAAAALQLGRPDLVLALGTAAPRAARAQALLALHDPGAVIALLQPAAGRAPPPAPEVYLLASALAEVGRPQEALALLEAITPADDARPVHAHIVQRLRQLLDAARQTDQAYLRR